MEESSQQKKHSCFHVSLIVAALLTFILLVIFHIIAAFSPNGLFVSLIGSFDLFFKYPTDVTPRGYAFGILGLIYLWQALWLIYAFSSIYRHGAEGPLYRSPILLPPIFFIFFITAIVLNIAWLFVWDRRIFIAAFVVQLFIPISLFICIIVSMVYLTRNLEVLTKNCLNAEKWWIWIGVQNGLATYATWATAGAALNFAIMLQETAKVKHYTAGSIAIGVLLASFVIWSLVELILFDRYSRYLFMPYVTIIWVFIGILFGSSVTLASLGNFIFVWIALSIVSIFGIAKLIVLLVKHYTRPLK